MRIGSHCTARESASLSDPPISSLLEIPSYAGRNEDGEQNEKEHCRSIHVRLRDKRLGNRTKDAMVRNAKFLSDFVAEK
jgi:hypothetical protein